jgi:nudix-type nucleoside diphosphatase (YffH/AdpP family)
MDYFQVEEHEVRFAQFTGGMSQEVKRACFVMGDAVTVLPYDPARDRVLVVEQFRYGPYVRGDLRPWSLEPIAGRIDPGEAPEAAVRREAREEAGLEIGALHHVAAYYPSPGAITEYLHSYVGLTDLPDEVAGVGGLEEEAEDIRAQVLSFKALMALLASGEAQNGPLILTALWLQANRAGLRA